MSRSKQRTHCQHSCAMCSPRKGKVKYRKVFRKRERATLADRAALVLGALVLSGCALFAPETPTPCTLTLEAKQQAAQIELEFMSEAVSACRAEGAKTRAACKAYPAIEAKYDARRAAWARCE